MKSHDCHVLMTTLLPIALRGIKTELVRDAVMSLCLFFNAIELVHDAVTSLCWT
jgi:hypothetical protein